MAQTNYSGSKFWMDDAMFNRSTQAPGADKNRDDLLKMLSVQRAISNFVRIVTGESYKVRFHNGSMSYTNGKMVTLSADAVKEKNFDAAVGLALHEGSHIKLSDFNLLRDLSKMIPQELYQDALAKHFRNPYVQLTVQLDSIEKKQADMYVLKKVMTILNWIEDRRIDYYIYTTAPGYRVYYKAMYKKYFESAIVDAGLVSGSYRKEEWNSYMFRFINLTNPKRDIKALKALPAIVKMLDLNNIGRLKSSNECLPLALEIYKLIENNIPATVFENPNKPKKEKNPDTIIGYTSNRLPNGITLNRKTGKMIGHTTEVGEHKIIITAHKRNMEKIRRKFILSIN